MLLRVTGLVVALSGLNGRGSSGGPSVPSPPGDAVAPVLSEPIVDLGQLSDFLPFGALLDSGQANAAHEAALTRFTARGTSVCLSGTVAP